MRSQLVGAQALDVLRRPDQADLLGAPPGEAQRVLRAVLAERLGDLDSAADPLPLSLIPGPSGTESRWAPAMTTLSSFFPRSSAITFCSVRVAMNVSTRAVDPACASAWPCGERGSDHRDRDVRRGAVLELADVADEQALPVRGVALVEDDHGLGAGVLGVEGLEGEEARAPLDQGDVVRPAEVEPGEVGDLTAAGAGSRRDEVDVDGDHRPGHLADGRSRVAAALVRRRHRRQLLELADELLVLEVLDLDLPAGIVPAARRRSRRWRRSPGSARRGCRRWHRRSPGAPSGARAHRRT